MFSFTRTSYLLIFITLSLILIGGLIYLNTANSATGQDLPDDNDFRITFETVNEIEPTPARDKYGFEEKSYQYEEYQVQRNESLYIILRRHDLSPQQIYQIQQASTEKANLSRIVPGQTYRIYHKDEEPISFVWQPTPTKYVTVDWEDGYDVSVGEIPVRFVVREASGVIRTSLYETIVGQGISPYLGSELASVFAWQIDFFGLRQGDHFKVIYEERYAGDDYVGIGDVRAAEFQHRGRTHKAYYFDDPERRGYFDEEGNSLEKELLMAPFRYNQRISSSFSRSRFHPILKERRPHYGTDYAAPTGTPILAVGDGVVTESRYRGGNGNIVQIRHNSSYKTAYLHLNGFASGIRKGARVEQGQVIGYVGQTGLATGPHLCYRLYVNDRPVNSVNADLPASESLEEELLPELQRVVTRYKDMLEEIPLMEKVANAEQDDSEEKSKI